MMNLLGQWRISQKSINLFATLHHLLVFWTRTWPDDGDYKEQKKRNISDVLPKFSSTDEVIAIGDMFYANVEEEWVMQPGGPLAHTCKTVLQPSRLIYITAQQFIQDFLGSNFVAVHFRRHGIWWVSLSQVPCILSICQTCSQAYFMTSDCKMRNIASLYEIMI